MTLKFHPAAAKPKTAIALAFAIGILLQALWQWLSPVSALAIWSALVFSLRDFYAPTTYQFQDENLVVSGPLKGKKTFPWRRFRTYLKDRNGLFLSPYAEKRATEAHRGLFLPLLPDQKTVVEEHIREIGLEKRLR